MTNENFHRIGKDGRKYYGMSGAGVFFTDGKSVLLLRRKEPSEHAGKWGLPGGKSEKGETSLNTAHREAREECGLDRIPGTRFASFEEQDGRHRFFVYCYSVDAPFKCRISKEHDQFEWVPLSELSKYPLHPRLTKQIPAYRKAVARRFPPKKFTEWLENR